jgi:hypothetical protein
MRMKRVMTCMLVNIAFMCEMYRAYQEEMGIHGHVDVALTAPGKKTETFSQIVFRKDDEDLTCENLWQHAWCGMCRKSSQTCMMLIRTRYIMYMYIYIYDVYMMYK